MRADAATILIQMGHKLDTDFVARQDKTGAVVIDWRAEGKPPTEAEIEAAAPAALAALQTETDKRTESTLARDDVKRAVATLDAIIAQAPTATTAQMRTGIAQMAQIIKQLGIATVGR